MCVGVCVCVGTRVASPITRVGGVCMLAQLTGSEFDFNFLFSEDPGVSLCNVTLQGISGLVESVFLM